MPASVIAATTSCDTCTISNEASASVDLRLDPVFDLGRIIGKVFQDKNRDDWQDADEPGVPNAMVVLDDGTYALTDAFGRFHFPAVAPGHRMLKINLHSLPPGTVVATKRSRVVWITPGLTVRLNFGMLLQSETESIGQPSILGLALSSEAEQHPIEVMGSAETLSLLINGEQIALPSK